MPSQAETIHDPEYLAAQELAMAAEEREAGENTAEQQDDENMDVDPPALPVKFPALSPQAAPKTGVTCLPQRAALLKSMLNFLKKAIQVNSFGGAKRLFTYRISLISIILVLIFILTNIVYKLLIIVGL